MSIDPTEIKKLLQSSDLDKLTQAAQEYDEYEIDENEVDDPAAMEEQILKLQLLLWNRILQLQKSQQADRKELAKSFQSMGRLWLRMGDCDKAIGQLNKALEIDNANGHTYELLSQAFSNRSDYDTAIDYQERAIPLLDDYNSQTLAYGELAGIHEAMCDFDQALQVLQIAEAKLEDESNLAAADIYGRIGRIHEKMGNYNDAVTDLSRALVLYTKLRGEDDVTTQEISYLLEVSKGYAS